MGTAERLDRIEAQLADILAILRRQPHRRRGCGSGATHVGVDIPAAHMFGYGLGQPEPPTEAAVIMAKDFLAGRWDDGGRRAYPVIVWRLAHEIVDRAPGADTTGA